MTTHATSHRLAGNAIAALAAGLLLTGCSLTEGSVMDGPRKTATADATVAEAVTTVEVPDTRAGSIEVTPGAGPGVTVRRTVHYRADTVPTPGQQVSAGVLTFSNGCSGSCSIDYRLEVPASATVKLESSSGRITVTGVAAAELKADSGEVRAERIAGPLKIRTSSGDVSATALFGSSTDVRSASGDARLDFTKVPSSVKAETSSGDVTVEVPPAPYRIDVSTSSGTKDVGPASDLAASSGLSVKTSSGDIRISAV
ncbi:DUF4097 family beta strand repeat-containing protein [Streptomyces sp. NPDC054849]